MHQLYQEHKELEMKLFFLRVSMFLLPYYIMARSISILQRRRQRQEAAASAASQIALRVAEARWEGLEFENAKPFAMTSNR
ncbi:RING/FYVE/PHD zinc finger superfamily protein [Artemisia annua]|uniref:RING/FYVE/PHD zinc finger superfamily protein n=1 Tax=Artemisia annua TaxID=35608 RepID=A0A2U1N6U0_ARTAN|nr:RING/FYVE/PHD zinc finger superfamily protein [Artemisia annua]